MCNWLDGKHTVFGEVADDESYKIVTQIENLGSQTGKPQKTVKISDCGQY